MRVLLRERIQQKMQEGVPDDVRRDVIRTAQNDRVMLAGIPNVRDASDQRLEDDGKCPRSRGILKLPEITRRHKNDLRHWVMNFLNFPIVDGLQISPEAPDFLLFVIAGENFAEAIERQHFRRHVVSPKCYQEFRRGPGKQTKPNVARERGPRVANYMLLVIFPNGVYRRPLLMLHLLPKTGAQRMPVRRAHV